MTIVTGKVVNGHIEVEDFELPEGGELTPEQYAELDAAIEEAARGEGVPADEVLRELRKMRDAETDRRQ